MVSNDQPQAAGFSLLEVVLAIALCGAVMALLTTAIDLYLVRVDTSRTQVETSQLARALLNEIADDLRAARFSGSSASLGSGIGDPNSVTGNSPVLDNATDLGIYGTLTELRIDRAARRSWRHVNVSSTQLPTETDPHDMPQTVEYYFVEGRVMSSAQFVAGGVAVDTSLAGYTGLYRRQSATSSTMASSAGSAAGTRGARSLSGSQTGGELIAPEVVKISFMYSDGVQWYEQWDSSAQQGLPVAIEIKLSLFSDVLNDRTARQQRDEETRRRDSSRWVEHRLLVRIPQLDEPQEMSGSVVPNSQQSPVGGQGNAN